MLKCQKEHFNIPEDIHYLNGAYMSPLHNRVVAAGQEGLLVKSQPFRLKAADFFDPVMETRALFAKIIGAEDPMRIAIIPSVSYGIANVVKNIQADSSNNIVVLEEQFPSNMYSWQGFSEQTGATIKIAQAPEEDIDRAKLWNQEVLNQINEKTVAVAMPHVHWADGTKFNLPLISQKCKQVGAKLIIDGTQSVGAMPFDVHEIKPDALICAAYKWLWGPYSIGVAYYGEAFDTGIPIEESWMHRLNSVDFANLVNYQPEYEPKAMRYNVGESANFILIPMMTEAFKILLEIGADNIQEYCRGIGEPYLQELQNMGCHIEGLDYRGSHLFGVRLGKYFNAAILEEEFKSNNIFVSKRGNAIRISPNVYNEAKELEILLHCFQKAKK